MKTLFFCVCIIKCIFASSSVVKVEEGELAGTTYTTLNGKVINAFYGVPYAAPPVFDYRFQDPQILKPWIGVWNASVQQNPCLQIEYDPETIYKIKGTEDCLYLNIFTPKLPKDGKTPLMNVLVFFHGGGFMFGDGEKLYPDYILEADNEIVFITLHYRLGILGFLSIDKETPGNFGMKDQVAALKWIKRNIINFGGNPASITISGGSAGGASVHYHLLSPLSKGLFQKGISISGTTLLPWTLPRNVTEKSIRLASLIGCPTDNTQNLVKCLQKRSPTQIVEASKNFMVWKYAPFTPFGPVVEPESPNAFLFSQPYDLLINGKVKDLPWLVTMIKNEGLYPGAEFVHSDVYLKELNDGWYKIAPNLLMYNYSVPENQKNQVSSAIKHFYFGNKPISKETVNEIIQLFGDRFFYNGIIDAGILHNLAVQKNIYCYKFNYRGEHSSSNIFAGNSVNYGVAHYDDIYYFLKTPEMNTRESESDLAVSKLMSSIIVTFIKMGNPDKIISQWKPIEKNQNFNLSCLNIYSATDLKMEILPKNSRSSRFWKATLPWEQPPMKTGRSYQHFISKIILLFSLFIVKYL